MTTIKSITKCPTCGNNCKVGGDGETHFYIPAQQIISKIQVAFYTMHHKVNHYEGQELVTKINEIIDFLNTRTSK